MTRSLGRFARQNTIALLALFIALGGTTFAAANALPKNSVGTKQLKKNAVTTKKIKNGAVTGAKIKLSSLGKVPSAANADHATTADSATNATNAANADKLDNLDSTAFLRSSGVAAYGAANSTDMPDFTTATYTTVLSKSFTAPTAGFALIIGSIGCADDISDPNHGSLWSRIAIDGTGTTNDSFSAPACYSEQTAGGGGTATNSVVVSVTAGTHAAQLQARSAASTGAYIYTRDLTVLFVPNGSATPIPFSHTSVSRRGSASQK
jgi:hypothetical protein